MSITTIKRPAAVEIDAGASGGPVHAASLARSVVETLSSHTVHPALRALDDLVFETGELLHVAITKRDVDGGTYAANKLEQVIALSVILEEYEEGGEWDSLGAAQYLLRDALQQLNELRGDWK
ncbi:hypothetical protein LJR039_005465 [Pseudorhodoferax sp. LjRoot39]|uniref:hypothetical protein n=1 Tax=Pseudorhodoferax sp. LjRoot39 TaxID=3342328 RepID=UPI003ED11AA5